MTLTEVEPAPTALGEVLLEARGVTKVFPGVRALDNVDFLLRGGQIHALCGENGAGKSTLMKVFAGLYQPDGGEVLVGDTPVTIPNPLAARHLGLSVIHQEFFLMNHLTVAQNIFIGREPKLPGGVLNDDRALNRKAQELLDRLGVPIDPRVQVGRLTVAAQQMVEIAKALSFDSRVLIMDEPTAALTSSEVETLFRIIRNFSTPETGVVYISHRMEEIKEVCNQITVLRDGQYVDSKPADQLEVQDIIHLMVGRTIAKGSRPQARGIDPEVVLEVNGLCTASLLRDVGFSLRRGEILGFAGLMGAGRTETARAVVGADPKTAGEVKVFGQPTRISGPADAVRHGIGYLSEDRKRYGLILGQTVTANIGLPSLPNYQKFGMLQDADMAKAAEKHCEALNIKTPSVRQQLRFLSGGNQQKVVLAKWLERDCDILIFDEPTRGIDVGAKQEIYDLLHRLVAAGKSIIMISSELEEVLRMSDRIVVMCDGRVTGVLDNADATSENIMTLATQFEAKEDREDLR